MKIKNCLSELIGTFLFIFASCFAICYFPGNSATIAEVSSGDPLAIAIISGLVYLVLFYSFGNTSGCYFNPVISLSALIQKRITFLEFISYFVSQLIGGVLGVLFLQLILPNFKYDYGTYATELCCNGDLIAAIFVEIIISYLMVLTFIGANSKSRNKNIRGLVFGAGIVITTLISSILNYSLANPIKAFASAITCKHWNSLIVFIISPFIGSILATYHFNWLKKDNETKEEN